MVFLSSPHPSSFTFIPSAHSSVSLTSMTNTSSYHNARNIHTYMYTHSHNVNNTCGFPLHQVQLGHCHMPKYTLSIHILLLLILPQWVIYTNSWTFWNMDFQEICPYWQQNAAERRWCWPWLQWSVILATECVSIPDVQIAPLLCIMELNCARAEGRWYQRLPRCPCLHCPWWVMICRIWRIRTASNCIGAHHRIHTSILLGFDRI